MSANIGRIDDAHFKLGTLELRVNDESVVILGIGMNGRIRKLWEYHVPDKSFISSRMRPTHHSFDDIEKARDKFREEARRKAEDIIECFQ